MLDLLKPKNRDPQISYPLMRLKLSLRRGVNFLRRVGCQLSRIEQMAEYIPTVPDWFPTRRAAQVLAFFGLKTGGKINVLRATKLIYLADRRSMEKRDFPITEDNFVSMPFGPVNTITYDYMNGRAPARQDEWAEFIGKRSEYDIPVAEGVKLQDLDELSRADLVILEETWAEFKDIEKYELSEWTHKFCPEWQDPGTSSIPIDFSTVYKKLGKSDPAAMAEEIQAERKLRLDLFYHKSDDLFSR